MILQARNRIRTALLIFGSLWTLGACGESSSQSSTGDAASLFPASTTCIDDSECAPTGICINGICSRQCTQDSDCSSELLVCENWTCVLAAQPDGEVLEPSQQPDISESPIQDIVSSDSADGPEPNDLGSQADKTDSGLTPPVPDASEGKNDSADLPGSDATQAPAEDIQEEDLTASESALCGDGILEGTEECDGEDVGGKTCQDLFFQSTTPLECNGDCTLSSLPCPGTHMLGYENILNIVANDDLHRLRWHPSGDFALILGRDGRLLVYEAASKSLSLVEEIDGTLSDLDVSADGGFFLLVGDQGQGKGRIWRVAVTQGGDLTPSTEFSVTVEASVATGTPIAIEAAPKGPEWVIGARTSTSTSANYLYLWKEGPGIHQTKGFVSGGLTDLMWAYPEIYGGKATVITSNGTFGADSQSFILETNTVVANGFSAGFGNPGGAGWRPDGLYGILTASTTNKAYVFNGNWQSVTLPGVGTAANPVAIGWKSDGSRALIVGRPIGNPLKATVIEHRPGTSPEHHADDYLDMSIPGYSENPWNANGNAYLLGVDWRPQSLCDEGLIVGADGGSSLAPTFGKLIRFYDLDDPDCEP